MIGLIEAVNGKFCVSVRRTLHATIGETDTEVSDQACLLLFLRLSSRVILLPGWACSNAVLQQLVGLIWKIMETAPFLWGPAAVYFHSLADDQKDTYTNLIKFLCIHLCPIIAHEQFYIDFERRRLYLNEDPIAFSLVP